MTTITPEQRAAVTECYVKMASLNQSITAARNLGITFTVHLTEDDPKSAIVTTKGASLDTPIYLWG
jgi:hypothetical protein